MEAKKYDQGKAPMGLIPHEALEGMASVLAHGARKYGPNNWRRGFEWSRLIDAAYRHLTAFNSGQDDDPESGLPHVHHLACCVAFLQAHYMSNLGTDDRYVQGAYEEDEVPQPGTLGSIFEDSDRLFDRHRPDRDEVPF